MQRGVKQGIMYSVSMVTVAGSHFSLKVINQNIHGVLHLLYRPVVRACLHDTATALVPSTAKMPSMAPSKKMVHHCPQFVSTQY